MLAYPLAYTLLYTCCWLFNNRKNGIEKVSEGAKKTKKKKAKEDKVLERVLELSKHDMGRIESASHLLKLRSSSPPSPPVPSSLGSIDGKDKPRKGRVCSFSGLLECDGDG